MRSFAAAGVRRTMFGPEVERWAAPAEPGLRDVARFVLRRSDPGDTERSDSAPLSSGDAVPARDEVAAAALFQREARVRRRNKA